MLTTLRRLLPVLLISSAAVTFAAAVRADERVQAAYLGSVA